MIKRAKNDLARYNNLYKVDRSDMSNYDFVLNTDNLTPKEVLQTIKEEYEKWKQN